MNILRLELALEILNLIIWNQRSFLDFLENYFKFLTRLSIFIS